MQLTFDQLPKQPVWFAYYGIDPTTNKPAHLASSGQLVPNVPSAKPTDALAHKATPGAIRFPMLRAARMYISPGEPIRLAVDGAGAPLPPMAADPNDVNYKTPWDFFELTYTKPQGTDGLFNVNLSNVQSANLPLAFQVGGLDPSTKKVVRYSRGRKPLDPAIKRGELISVRVTQALRAKVAAAAASAEQSISDWMVAAAELAIASGPVRPDQQDERVPQDLGEHA